MNLPVLKPNTPTERAGINFVRSVTEGAGCIFHQVHQEDDYGIDAFLELVDEGRVTGKCIAVQVKSGQSYCSPQACHIRHTSRQATYWKSHSLPVLGIVFDPSEHCAYWVDLGARCHATDGTFSFAKTSYRRFDERGFRSVVLPLLLGHGLAVTFDEAREFAASSDDDAHIVGLRTLLAQHADNLETWECFTELLTSRRPESTSPHLVYALAHIPWHGDIFAPPGFNLPDEMRSEIRRRMAGWDRSHVLSLVRHIDENGIQRGYPGQSVYAIVDIAVSNGRELVLNLVDDETLEEEERQKALILYCFLAQLEARETLERYAADDGLLGLSSQIALEHLDAGRYFRP